MALWARCLVWAAVPMVDVALIVDQTVGCPRRSAVLQPTRCVPAQLVLSAANTLLVLIVVLVVVEPQGLDFVPRFRMSGKGTMVLA